MPWTQNYSALAGSIGFTSLAVAVPILYLFWALAVKKMTGHIAGVTTLILTILDVVIVYKMPVSMAISASILGVFNGLFPIAWIVFSAVFLYNLVVEAGQFDVIKSSIASLSDDRRLQTLLIAFSFGAFLEGAAGFGAPVAIAGAILIGLGFEPLYAAGLCLIADTAPVAFGGIGSPIIAAGSVTGISANVISQAVGRQLPFLSILVPMYLIIVLAGWKKTVEVLPAVLIAGGSFAITQFFSSNYLGAYLPDIISSLVSLVCTAAFLKVWKPKTIWRFPHEKDTKSGTAVKYTGAQILKAWTPFIILTIFVGIWGVPAFKDFVAKDLRWFINIKHWPGLDGLIYKAAPIVPKPTLYPANYEWDFFSAAGTAILLAAIISSFILGLKPSKTIKVFGATFKQLLYPIIMMGSVLGIAYLANYSGMSFTLGLLFASTGKIFPFLSPILGWLGVFLTGSDTSSNALFGKLQMTTASQLGLNPVLAVSANSSGGVMGKMISPQSLAVAAAGTNQVGKESSLFRFTFKHSLGFVVVVGIIILLQAYVFPGMLPHVTLALQ
ncbi:lactate permease LctP family transporter [Desulfosporosinus sp. FKA]|uniref:L-lactate permease n=1 Tax=Desulfosporosinus sp. FKA TaxID=1969834 RepID=UPI000B49CD37|nr:lactate permease LctP family transporter [Desulfosporosinus sp. FKA]